jgi:hypothetical protein
MIFLIIMMMDFEEDEVYWMEFFTDGILEYL